MTHTKSSFTSGSTYFIIFINISVGKSNIFKILDITPTEKKNET